MKSLILLLFFSFFSWAKSHRGDQSCDLSSAEAKYKQDSKNQYLYASCVVINGEDAKGLPQLYDLADRKNNVTASFFLADYLETDGRFAEPSTDKNLDKAIQCYLRVQGLIALIPDYPEPDYLLDEKKKQMELRARYRVPYLYLKKYHLGAFGDHCQQASLFSSEHKEDCSTYPQYNTLMLDSLNKALRYAEECADLPLKKHFDKELYISVKQSCNLLKELVLNLTPLEKKGQEVLLRPNCKDRHKAGCLEYFKVRQKIYDLILDFTAKEQKAFQF